MPENRVLRTTDESIAKKFLPRKGRFTVLYFREDLEVGRRQLQQLELFLEKTDRRALAVDIGREDRHHPHRPLRLTRMPTIAVFRDGQVVKTAEGLFSCKKLMETLA